MSNKLCAISECNNKAKVKNLCKSHYQKKWHLDNRNAQLEYKRLKYRENREYNLEYAKKYREANREVVNRKTAEWRLNNRELYLETKRRYRNNNPEKHYTWIRLRAERLNVATPKWLSRNQLEEIRNIHSNCPVEYEVDHIIPLAGKDVCGLNVPWNLQYLTIEEHRKKGIKYIGMPQ